MEKLITCICGEVGVLKTSMIDIVKVLKSQNRQLGLVGVCMLAGGIYVYQNEKYKKEALEVQIEANNLLAMDIDKLKKEVKELKLTKGE